MSKLSLADLTAEPTTFDLGGHTYTVRTFTRDVQQKHDAALERFRAEPDGDSDKNVALLVKCIETLFAADEGAPPFGKALVDAWKKNEIGVGQLHALFEAAQEAAYARPTSRRQN